MKTGKKRSSDENVEWSKEGEISIFFWGGEGGGRMAGNKKLTENKTVKWSGRCHHYN